MVLVFTSAVSKFRVHEISFAFGWFPPADEMPRCSAFFSCLQFLQIQLKPIFSRSTCIKEDHNVLSKRRCCSSLLASLHSPSNSRTLVPHRDMKEPKIQSCGNAGNGQGVRTCLRCSAFWYVILCNSMPPKRKDRPKSSSSDAFSPEEKKSKEANRSTSTNEAEDEVLTALSMAGDLGKKVDMILNKLQKLDNIEARLDNLHKSIASLEESFAFLEKDVQNLKDKTEKTRTKVDELEKSVEFREVDISDMQKDLKKVQHEAEELKMQLLYQEHYSRRENLMFPNHVCAMIFKPV